jgi:hypothetical protein
MKFGRWKDVFELVGVFSIVASLIFVGLQMKQSQDIAIAAQYQERATTSIDYYAAVMASEIGLSVWAKRTISGLDATQLPSELKEQIAALPPDELAFNVLEAYVTFLMFDNHHFQYESGFLPEDSWRVFRAELKSYLAIAFIREFFRMNQAQYRPSFRAITNEVISEIDAPGP